MDAEIRRSGLEHFIVDFEFLQDRAKRCSKQWDEILAYEFSRKAVVMIPDYFSAMEAHWGYASKTVLPVMDDEKRRRKSGHTLREWLSRKKFDAIEIYMEKAVLLGCQEDLRAVSSWLSEVGFALIARKLLAALDPPGKHLDEFVSQFRKVHDHLCAHPGSSTHQISEALGPAHIDMILGGWLEKGIVQRQTISGEGRWTLLRKLNFDEASKPGKLTMSVEPSTVGGLSGEMRFE